VVVTRTRSQASELGRRLRELGADVLEIPTLRIEPPKALQPLVECIVGINEYNWLVFTSPHGVSTFFDTFFKAYPDIRSVGNLRIAAVGPATSAKITELHLQVDAMPEQFVAAKVADAHGAKPASLSDEEWALVLSHRTRAPRAATPAKRRTPSRKPAAGKPASAKPAATKAPAAKAVANKPAAAKPASTKPAASKPAVSKPAASKSAASKPAARKPAARKPVVKSATSTNVSTRQTRSSVAKRMAKAVSRMAPTVPPAVASSNGAVKLPVSV
jgi:hypothetical protein